MNTTITPQELQERLRRGDRLQLIDVRSPGEFNAEHVPQAVNMPVEQVDRRLDDLQHEAPVVLICQSGNRASMACQLLREHHDNLIILDGGTSAWVSAGLPTVAGGAARWAVERQVRLLVGILVLTGTGLSMAGIPSGLILTLAIGAGLVFAGISGYCPMMGAFAAMPWNKPRPVTGRAPLQSAKP